MYGRYRNPPPKSGFIPKSTAITTKATASFIKNAHASLASTAPLKKGATVSSSAGTDEAEASRTNGTKDIFGLGGGFQVDGGDGSGFWIPEMSVAREPTPRATVINKNEAGSNIMGPSEVFDGYHVWREFQSQTKKRPFWHCKETGATRWEKPVAGAVQNVDKIPEASASTGEDNLLEGDVDEAANRRAFLAALYEWRNAGQSQVDTQQEKGKENSSSKRTNHDSMKDAGGDSKPNRGQQQSFKPLVKSASRAPQVVTLHSAAGNGEAHVVQDMLRTGADPLAKDRLGLSALHYAASGGHVATIEALVQGGAECNARDGDNDTPLHSAAKNGHTAAVRRLVELGADTTLANTRGNSALRLAQMFRKQEIQDILQAAPTIKLEADERRAAQQEARQNEQPLGGCGRASVGLASDRTRPVEGKHEKDEADTATDFACGCDLDAEEAHGPNDKVLHVSNKRGKDNDDSQLSRNVVSAKVEYVDDGRHQVGDERVDEAAASEARALLEALRAKAHMEVESRWSSRPSTAASSRPVTARRQQQEQRQVMSDCGQEDDGQQAVGTGAQDLLVESVMARIGMLELERGRPEDEDGHVDGDDGMSDQAGEDWSSGDESLHDAS